MLQCNWVAVLGPALGTISLILPWLTLRSSRLAAGEGVRLPEAAGAPLTILIVVLWVSCLWASFGTRSKRRTLVPGIAGTIVLPLTLLVAGTGATHFIEAEGSIARASLGAGVWLSLLAAYVLIHTSRLELTDRPNLRSLLTWLGPALVLAVGMTGLYGDISLVQEFQGNESRFLQETTRHVLLCAGSVTIGTCIAIPLGIAAARSRRAAKPIITISSAIETIPSLALFGLIIAPLSALSYAYPALREMGIRGVGATPALIALVLYSLLPIVHNTYAGLREVSPAALDAGRGMGMSRRQLAWKVEFPLAAPLIAEGVRTAAVQAVGNTTVAALIGAGGLGHFIFQGLGQAAPDLILLGALPVIALALAIDVVMRMVVRRLTPRGLGMEAGQ